MGRKERGITMKCIKKINYTDNIEEEEIKADKVRFVIGKRKYIDILFDEYDDGIVLRSHDGRITVNPEASNTVCVKVGR